MNGRRVLIEILAACLIIYTVYNLNYMKTYDAFCTSIRVSSPFMCDVMCSINDNVVGFGVYKCDDYGYSILPSKNVVDIHGNSSVLYYNTKILLLSIMIYIAGRTAWWIDMKMFERKEHAKVE